MVMLVLLGHRFGNEAEHPNDSLREIKHRIPNTAQTRLKSSIYNTYNNKNKVKRKKARKTLGNLFCNRCDKITQTLTFDQKL